MSTYANLQKVSFEDAITALADLALGRGLKNKVMLVCVRMSANDFKKDKSGGDEFTIVVYRPHNYCFVGMVEGAQHSLDEGQDVHYESYHDSCWRDGINRMIRAKANKVIHQMEEHECNEEDISVHTSFGLFDPKLIDGVVVMNDDDRTAKFKMNI